MLVVPTLDDVERFERELTGAGRRWSAPRSCTFDRLFALVARATERPRRPATEPHPAPRDGAGGGLARRAQAARRLRAAARASPAALEELISELQAASIDPVTLRERAAEAGAYEVELAALYEAYVEVRDELGRHDEHSRGGGGHRGACGRTRRPGARVRSSSTASMTSRSSSSSWCASSLGATQVTVALPWEDREVLTAARGALFAQLRDIGGVDDRRSSRPSPATPAAGPCSSSSAASASRATRRSGSTNDGGLSPCSRRPGSWPRWRRSAPRWRAC